MSNISPLIFCPRSRLQLINIAGAVPITLSAANYALLQPSVSWSIQWFTDWGSDADEIAWVVSYVDANNWIGLYRDNGVNRAIARVVRDGVSRYRRMTLPAMITPFVMTVSWDFATNTLRLYVDGATGDATSNTTLVPGFVVQARLFSNNLFASDDEQFIGTVTKINFFAGVAWDAAQAASASNGTNMGNPTWTTTGTYLNEP